MGEKTQRFDFADSYGDVSAERLWIAVIRTIGNLGYTLISSDSVAKIASFNTGRSWLSSGGQNLSASVQGDAKSAVLVMGGSLARGGTPFGGGTQLGAWGEKGKLITKFSHSVAELLPGTAEPRKAEQTPTEAISIGGELEKLASLWQNGSINDSEYAAAKARLLR